MSVVMPVYNGERFLREAVESVLTQTLSDIEVVVIDDGSTDSTPQILAEYASNDSRLVVRRQGNRGRARALNHGFALARAPLIARLDADDIALPNRLERQSQFLSENEAVAAVGGAVTFMAEDARAFADVQYPLTDAEIREAFAHSTPLAHPAAMVRKDVFERVGGYRPIFVEAEDVDLWLRIAERHELANLPELVIRYRMHAAQATVGKLDLQTLCSVAARVSARARLERRPDPLETAERIDYETLLAIGATPEEITEAVVRNTLWLAKAMSSAGYTRTADELFTAARDNARSESGSLALVALVHRERARRYAEQRHRLRATLETVRAALVERRG